MRWLMGCLFLLGAGCTSVPAPVVLAEGEGVVRLKCLVQEDGQFANCRVLSERPAGRGFGEAALRAAQQSRLDPDALRAPGSEIEYNVRFRLDEPAALDLQPPRA